jgi:PEP-CTERM motif
MKVKLALSLVAAVVATLVAGQAHAQLLGSTVNTQYYAYGSAYNGGSSPSTFVANGTPQNTFFNYYDLTVSDTQIIYNFTTDVTWSSSGVSLNSDGLFITNGNLLTFANAPSFTSVTLDGASTAVSGFSLSNITFNASSVATDWQNVAFHTGDQVILNVNAVPEPETYAMMLAGLGVMGTIARRRRAKQTT